MKNTQSNVKLALYSFFKNIFSNTHNKEHYVSKKEEEELIEWCHKSFYSTSYKTDHTKYL